MKAFRKIIVISIVIGYALFNNLGALNQDYSDTEKKIWQLEEKYWEHWINKDMEGYLSLLHDGFIGWPSQLEMPSGKKSAQKFVQDFWNQVKLFGFDMKPAAIKIIDGVAIVHYFVNGKDEAGNRVGSRYRITHTWIKQGGKWQVMGGMSSAVNDKIDKD